MSGVQHLIIEAEEAEQRLDRWFKRRFPHIPHGRLEKMLRKGEIRLDGARAKAADRVAEGQSVRVPPLPEPDEDAEERGERRPAQAVELSAEDIAFAQSLVIYRDADVIALNKPPGLPVQGGTRQNRHVDGLLDALRFERGDRPRLVHRLDKDTSGVLLLARSVPAAAALAKSFHQRSTRKIYWAAVAGRPKPPMGQIRYALAKQPGHGPHGAGEKMVCLPPDEHDRVEGAKPALTDYAVLESLGSRASWVALRPVTGRTHQLRAHMAEIGCPIVGDGKYGTNKTEKESGVWGAQLGGEISRKLHLHARSIDIPHPVEKRRLSVKAPMPEHMLRTWETLGWRPEDALEDPFEDL